MRLAGWCSVFAPLLALAACSGHVGSSDASGGAAGSGGHVPAGAGGVASPSAGHSASGGGGSTGTALGGSGAGGNETGGAGMNGSGGTSDVPTDVANATLLDLQGSGISGTVVVNVFKDDVKLLITLAGCPAGAHALHLHANPSCADAGNAAGGHWSPQGEGIPDLTCSADGVGTFAFEPPSGTWSVGPPQSSDLLAHAVVLHAGSGADPGARLACAVLAKIPQ